MFVGGFVTQFWWCFFFFTSEVSPDLITFNASLSACEKLQRWMQATKNNKKLDGVIGFLRVPRVSKGMGFFVGNPKEIGGKRHGENR